MRRYDLALVITGGRRGDDNIASVAAGLGFLFSRPPLNGYNCVKCWVRLPKTMRYRRCGWCGQTS